MGIVRASHDSCNNALHRSHTTGMQSKVHPTYKTKYRVANWAAYNRALVRRGDVTLWVSSEAITAWTPRRSGRRGGQRRYSDLAIETALTLRLLSHLPLRQAEGFLHALFGMMRLDLSAPDETTLSRRSQHLRRRLRSPVPPGEGLHLVLDSTGLSLVGAGEWATATHGGRGRRGWRKLHRGVDQSGVIRVHTLTGATGDNATTAFDLLTAGEGPLVRVTADAVSDTVAVYETATARGATVIIPPARTANVSGHGPRSPARDRTVTWVKQLGRRRWKQVSGYHRQGRVENTFFRDTSIIGDGLRARSPARQGSEVVLGCAILKSDDRPRPTRVISHRPVRILSVGIVRARDDSCNNACAGKARSRGTRCRDVIVETLFDTLWVSNPIRPRSATSRNRVMRGPGVTQGAKRSQGVRRPRDGAPKCIGREGRRRALDGRLHRRL